MASSIEAIKAKVQDVLPSRSAPASVSHITYVDTDVGADNETADGSEKKPYQSLSYAYIRTGNDKASYLTRQSMSGPVSADGDPSERLDWKEPAKSAVKKAQNAFDQHKKKLLKQRTAVRVGRRRWSFLAWPQRQCRRLPDLYLDKRHLQETFQ